MTETDPLKRFGMHHDAKPEIFRNAAKLRENMTEAELKLWEFVRKKPLGYKFRRQHPIGVYVLDFYCHKLRISIEIDGDNHLNNEQKERDAERTTYLISLGITEYRLTNRDVLNDFDKTIEIVNGILRAGPPSGVEGAREK